jgi:hypothetical protein
MIQTQNPLVIRLPLALSLCIAGLTLLAVACLAGEWSDDIRLTEGAPEVSYIRLDSDSRGHVHLVWREKDYDGIFNIWYARVDSVGETVVSPRQLTDTPGWSWAPNLAVDSRDNVHIFWREQGSSGLDVWYTKLDTAGETLIEPHMVVDAMGTNFDWLLPAVGVDHKDNLHLVWDQHDNYTGIHYTKLDDEGNILVEDVYLSWQGNDARSASLAIDGWGNVHIPWSDARGTPASYELVYSKLDNNGNTLVDNISLTPEPDGKNSRVPDVVVDSEGNVHICFIDNRSESGGWDVWYTKLDNGGEFLIEPRNLAPTPTSAGAPNFAIDCWDTLHLVWPDFDTGLGLHGSLPYVKMATDGSIVDTLNLVPDPSAGWCDVTSSSNANVSVAWKDYRNGTEDVYFKYYDADCGCPDVSVYLTPDTTVVHRSGRLGYDILVRNNTGISQTFQAWTDVILPNGKPYKGNPVLGPKTVLLQPRKWVIRHITQQVPGNAPLGDYIYMGTIGTWPDSLVDQDQFEFTVVEARKEQAEAAGTRKTMKHWEVIEGDDW